MSLSTLSVRDRLNHVIERAMAENSAIRSFTIDDQLADIGFTSIDMVNLLLAVEAEFDIEIPQLEITPENFGTIAGIQRLVARLV
jgi:acyl carrier protein